MQCFPILNDAMAVLYYTSWWDFGGIKIEIGGMDPNCHHPKPRPTTPHDFFDSVRFQYQKVKMESNQLKTYPTQHNPTNAL